MVEDVSTVNMTVRKLEGQLMQAVVSVSDVRCAYLFAT